MTKHISDLTLAYIENRLTPGARARFERHVGECAACRAEVDSLRQTRAALKEATRVLARLQVRPATWARVRARLAPTLRPGVLPAVRRSWQVTASVAVVVMALASNLTLNAVRAATPSVPAIQTPAAQVVILDTATIEATRTSLSADSTFTPTLTPGPGATN